MDDNTRSSEGLRKRIVASLRKPRKVRQTPPSTLPQAPEVSTNDEEVNITPNTLPATQTAKVSADNEGVNVAPNVLAATHTGPVPAGGEGVNVALTANQLDLYGDRERTERRYKEAVEQLEKSLNIPTGSWKTFEIPDFKDAADMTDPISQLRQEIKKTLDRRTFKDPSFSSKSKHITERIFTALSPFAKNVLSVLKQGSAVFPD